MLVISLLGCLFVFLSGTQDTKASSLWAVTGEKSRDGGTLFGQTWDVPHGTRGELRLVIPKNNLRYLGLFPLNTGKDDVPVAGVNECGLAVGSAMPETLARGIKYAGGGRVVEKILTSFPSVDAVLTHKDIFLTSPPLFLLLADHSKIAIVEIGPSGHISVDTTVNGLLYHTNHYRSQDLLKYNGRYSEGSLFRLNRLQHFLRQNSGPISLDDFLSMAQDQGQGPDLSIWRAGSSLQRNRTLSSLVMLLPRNKAPELYFRLANPGNNELYYEMKLDRPFWTEATQ